MARGPESEERDLEVSRAAALVLLLASVLLHVPFAGAHFGFDDRDFIQVNESIRTLSGAWTAMTEPFPPDQPERGLYRPVTNLSYAVDHALFGLEARGFHATNVVLYGIVVWLVYQLALRYRYSPGSALAVALLFSVHPVHTGAVDSLAGRSELLALAFGVTSILLLLRSVEASRRRVATLAGALLAFVLACLSKETGAVLPGVLAFHVLLFHPPASPKDRERRRRILLGLAGYAVVLLGYLTLRFNVLGRFSPELGVLAGESLETRLLTMGSVFFEYLRLLVYPRILQVDFYYHDTIGIVREASASAIGGLTALTLVLALLVCLVYRRLRGKPSALDSPDRPPPADVVAILSLAIFLVFLLPVSHVLDIGALVAERFLLAPSLGFVLLVVLTGGLVLRRLARLGRHRVRVAAVLVLVLAVGGGWRSASRAVEWRDPVRLWESAAVAIPWDPRVHANMAAAHLERGNTAAARSSLERALELDPRNPFALGNLGVLQLQKEDSAGAAATYRQLLELQPTNAVAWHNLGLAEAQRLRHSEAVPLYQRSLELNANFAPAHENLLESRRVIAQAEAFLAAQREQGPSSEDPHLLNELAAACVVIGEYLCAEHFASRRDRFQEP
jgi:Flp pilus assembly protein TadD